MAERIEFDPLAPVRQALLAAADRDAAAVRARARCTADQIMHDAVAQAEAIRADAHRQGSAAAARTVVVERAHARRAARATVLRAQREADEALVTAARAAVARLVDDPDYPRLRAGMVRAIHRALGPDADIRAHPDGGVVGLAGPRRVDFSLRGLADRVLEQVLANPVLANQGDR
jgi:vacuolar-type H+-ATPase subunit E/Vma4